MKNSIYITLLLALIGLMPVRTYEQTIRDKIRAQQAQQREDVERDPETRLQKMRAEDERIRREMGASQGPVTIKLSKKDLEHMKEMRKVDPSDLEKYDNFLKSDKTGIFKLFPNMDCVTPKLIRIDGECARFVPGSSFFSFRTKQYSDILNQDMGLVFGELMSGGFFSQGIFVPLGNMPLENVALENPGVKFLVEMKPDTEAAAAKVRAAEFRKGVTAGEFTYASHAKAVENTTYALRLIAYKFGHTLVPSPESTMLEQLFFSLTFDKRVDSIIAFRVMKMEPGGNATILWKELSRKESPKLKFAKGEAYNDFK